MHGKPLRRVLLPMLVFVRCLALPAEASANRSPETCGFDEQAPSLEHARQYFSSLDFDCAALEIEYFLRLDSIAPEEKAEAHVLLAAARYGETRHDDPVIDSLLRTAFRTKPDWSGKLPLREIEFVRMVQNAQDAVAAEIEAEQRQRVAEPEKPLQVLQPPDSPSYTLPLIGSSVFLASGVAFVIFDSQTRESWNAYAADPELSAAPYESYLDSHRAMRLSAAACIASGAIAGYLWYKYLRSRSIYNNDGIEQAHDSARIEFHGDSFYVTWTFSF